MLMPRAAGAPLNPRLLQSSARRGLPYCAALSFACSGDPAKDVQDEPPAQEAPQWRELSGTSIDSVAEGHLPPVGGGTPLGGGDAPGGRADGGEATGETESARHGGAGATVRSSDTGAGDDAGFAAAELCDSGWDEDGDGLTDCLDPDCFGPGCAEMCRNPDDEDSDGLVNCEDADCLESCVERCAEGVDEDEDGDTDCADVDCALHVACWQGLELVATEGGVVSAQWRQSTTWRYDRTYYLRSTLTLYGVALAGSSAGGETRCAATADTLRLERTRATTSWSMRTTSIVGLSGALSLSPGCPPPTGGELLEAGLRLPWLITGVGSGFDGPEIDAESARLSVDGLAPRSWVLGGLAVGPERVWGLTWSDDWGSGFFEGAAQTAQFDRLERAP
jgi:hypothetical protein